MDNFFTTEGIIQLNAWQVIFNIVLAIVLTLAVAIVYKKSHRGLSYSQTFVFTLVLLGTIASVVMMIIGNSVARAFGLLGAFTIIRFRTAIKDPKDIAFVFLALVIGMAVGTNNYFIAVAATVLLLLLIIILTRFKFGSIRKYDYVLSFQLDSQASSTEVYKDLFSRYLRVSNLLNIKTLEQGKILDLAFSISFLDEKESTDFISKLEQLNGISEVNLIVSKNDIEY